MSVGYRSHLVAQFVGIGGEREGILSNGQLAPLLPISSGPITIDGPWIEAVVLGQDEGQQIAQVKAALRDRDPYIGADGCIFLNRGTGFHGTSS